MFYSLLRSHSNADLSSGVDIKQTLPVITTHVPSLLAQSYVIKHQVISIQEHGHVSNIKIWRVIPAFFVSEQRITSSRGPFEKKNLGNTRMFYRIIDKY